MLHVQGAGQAGFLPFRRRNVVAGYANKSFLINDR
jgi:hypothetical protein